MLFGSLIQHLATLVMPLDFSGQNLRGRSFKGQHLTGANFSCADIRSADFTGANLKSADFSHAKAGLQKRWGTLLVIVSWLLSGLSGLLFGFTSLLVAGLVLKPEVNNQIAGLTAITIALIFFFFTIRQGILAGLRAVSFSIAVVVILAFFTAYVFAIFAINFGIAFVVSGVGAIAMSITSVFVIVVAFAVAFFVGGAKATTGAGVVVICVAIFITQLFGSFGAKIAPGVGAGSGILILLSIYIGWRTLKGDEKHTLSYNFAIAFAAFGGTRFYETNLTDAYFTGATLKSTDFRKAILIRTCFHKTKKLDRVRPGTTYLQRTQVRQVLVTGRVQNKKFDREDLRGVNFKGADLVDASFIGADLSSANLQDCDLSRAKLVQTQLDGTDLTGATLTGVIAADWNITTHTKLRGVRCEYIYMRLPTKDNLDPLRKPDNNKEVFADGEFENFIQPIFDTLDLYHNQGVDPRAIAIAFKELAETNPEAELEIVALEKRGDDKILLRAQTAITANKSELSRKYFINYNQIKSLAEKEIQALISEKDSRIRSLENIVVTISQGSKFYIERGIMSNNFDFTGANIPGGVAGTNYGKMVETQINYAAQQNLAEAAAEIQQLLEQLEETNPTTTEAEKLTVVVKAAEEIKKNPTLKARVIGALESGGTEAFKEAVDNPLVNILVAIIEGWTQAE